MVSARLTRNEHIEALLRREPAWTAVGHQTGPTLAVYGPVVLFGGTGKAYRFRVRIDIPKEFPARDAHPDVWVLESPFPFTDDAHIDDYGNVCLELPQAHDLDYERIGLVGVLDHVIFHVDRLRIHALTGRYPGPEYHHGEDGVRQFLKEKHAQLTRHLPPALAHAVLPGVPMPPDRQRCPCGSGMRFGKCHKEAVRTARRELSACGPFPRRTFQARCRNPFVRK
jgi:hypothetical protein